FDFRARRRFGAGPFTGTLVSTLVARPDGTDDSSTVPPPNNSGGSAKLFEYVKLRYRIAALPGGLETTFKGAASPFCVRLGSCGVSGLLASTLGNYRETVTLIGARRVGRRVGRRRALADLKAGRLAPIVGDFDQLLRPTPMRSTEALARN